MSDRKERDLNARRRAALDGDSTHIRCWEWFWDKVTESPITLLGTAQELHGSVCTCCPRRDGSPLSIDLMEGAA